MGYSLHIIRTSNPSSGSSEISLEEWLTYCDHDPEMMPVATATATNPATGEEIAIHASGTALYEPLDNSAGDTAAVYFNWLRGKISFDGSSGEAIAKAISISKILRARVIGDEGEFYRADGSHYYD